MEIPYASRVDTCVIHQSCISIPVTIYVHWPYRTCTCNRIVGHTVANCISCRWEVRESHQRLWMTLLVRVIEQAEVIGEGWLQTRVTNWNVLWVSVVDDTQQLTHRRLSNRTLIIDTQVALLAELVTEVESRTPVEYCARCVNVCTEVILHIGRVLWLEHHTHVHLPLVTNHSHHYLHVVCVGAILRVTTQVIIEIACQWIGKQSEIIVPWTVSWLQTTEGSWRHSREVVGVTVALWEAILKLIAELQIGFAGNWFTISCL